MLAKRIRAAGLFACFALALGAQKGPKQLRIVRAGVHQIEDGPELASGFRFLTGETVFFSFQLAGYEVQDERVKLFYDIEVRDPDGTLVVEKKQGHIASEVSREDKDWLPKVRASFQVPPLAETGMYHITVVARDELNGTGTQQNLEFGVRGRAVESSPTLVVRNFRFLRTEEDRDPLVVAAYRPGDTLWARFDITGYKLAERNRFEVEYDIAVVNAEGKQLFSQPQAAIETDESFYPKRYVPCTMSLNLQKSVATGQYAIVLTVRDRIGSQTYESRHPFRVEE